MWGAVVGDLSATSRSPRSSGRSYKSSRRGTASTYTSSRLEVLRLTKGDARVWARRYVGRHPFLFYNFYRLRPSYRDLLVDRRTQIVIEDFHTRATRSPWSPSNRHSERWSGSMPSSAPGSRPSFTPRTTANESSTV